MFRVPEFEEHRFGVYPAFAHCINKAVDLVLRRMAENPELRKDRSEDELTIEVVSMLRMTALSAGRT
jgi:hypothetical protein